MGDGQSETREQWLADTLIELADSLTADFDLLELLGVLVARCSRLLEASEVGIVLRDPHGALTVMASSSERMRALELFEVQRDQGPCLDCIAWGTVVAVEDLADEGRQRWPLFAERALEAGYVSALALPMRLRETTIGAVNVLLDHGPLPGQGDVKLAQALADTATISILQNEALSRSMKLADQLEFALTSRIVLEQAKGMIAESLDVDVDTAFRLLRTHARNNHLKLGALAADIVQRTVPPRALNKGPMGT